MAYRDVNVKTQAELDAALARKDYPLCVGSGYFVVSGSATVSAYDSATVSAGDSATVSAYGSATVRAYGSATVRAYGSATVSAYGSATVSAGDSATVRAGACVPVQTRGDDVKVTGGVVIPIRQPKDASEWCAFYGVTVSRGYAVLYKAIDDDWRGSHKTAVTYEPGAKPAAPDWDPVAECGHGLHFSPVPFMALAYNQNATRFVACKVKVADCVLLDDKVKAPRCTVLHEVDEAGRELPAREAA